MKPNFLKLFTPVLISLVVWGAIYNAFYDFSLILKSLGACIFLIISGFSWWSMDGGTLKKILSTALLKQSH